MGKKHKVKVNDHFDFECDKKEVLSLDVQSTFADAFHVLKDHRSFKAEILAADFYNKKYTVRVNSNTYEIAISDELDVLIDEMGLSFGNGTVINDIKAPMPGIILDVDVQSGDEIKEGDHLLVLEAMKMENTLSAPRDGIVKSVMVKKGQTVEKNQLLIEME